MLSSERLIDAFARETRICKHLAGKVAEADLAYRPSDSQRSTLELMRYLAFCLVGSVTSLLEGDPRWPAWYRLERELSTMPASRFDEALDRQMGTVRHLLHDVTEEELRTRIVELPGVGKIPLGNAIVESSYAWIIAYRHELFLRAKATSAPGIGQVDGWGGGVNG